MSFAMSFLLSLRSAFGTKPFAFRLGREIHTAEMEPLDGTLGIVAADHLAVRHLMTQTVRWFIGIHWHVQHI